jgi:hypothetical protein
LQDSPKFGVEEVELAIWGMRCTRLNEVAARFDFGRNLTRIFIAVSDWNGFGVSEEQAGADSS